MNKSIIPLLSKDIIFYPINKNEFFIHQTIYDHRIKISFELYNLLNLINNDKNLKTIVLEYNLKYNDVLTEEFAKDFLFNKLAKYGIIMSDEVLISSNEKPNYLKLSFIFINKNKVAKLTKYLKYLFVPKVIYCLLATILFVLTFSFYTLNNQIFHSTISRHEWLIFFLLSFIGVTFHELGHASASAYYGAKHGGIGGGFYLFMPVYFADVTDIWKLPKSQRIIVNLAGMYFELIYVIFLIGLGFIFKYNLLIILSCIFSISILHSLNPFVRSDGYWILSDAIEKPNMMTHGLIRIKHLFKSKKTWVQLDYFLLIYGLISCSFILFFVYYVIIKNPNSILYFPQNFMHFIVNLFSNNAQFSLAELGKLFIPMLFFYLAFGLLRNLFIKKKSN
jgi:putative peptide zinc metalloprotease protein